MGKKKVAELTGETTKPAEEAVAKVAAAPKRTHRLETGRIYINSSYNNTVVTVTDMQGNVITWATAGTIGFAGPKKATPFAASKIVGVLAEKLKTMGMANVEIILKGLGGGRDSAVRSLVNQGFNIVSIKDVTPIPHNGPRPKKVRRV